MSRRRAYFLLAAPRRDGPFNYPHQAVALAEGLSELGWDVAANAAAWRQGRAGPELFRPEAEEWAAGADLVVVDLGWPDQTRQPLPTWLFDAGRRFRTVGVDHGDVRPRPSWCHDPQLRGLDVVLRAHYSAILRYPANVRPWAFGLSRRITDAIDGAATKAGPKRRRVVWNFQHKEHPHDVRVWCERRLLPKLQEVIDVDTTIHRSAEDAGEHERLMFRQTCGRHCAGYFAQLAESLAVAAFGGWFTLPLLHREGGRTFRLGRRLMRQLGTASRAVAQWDSWRFWEALYAGAAPLQMDFDHFNMRLPEMPVAGEHYLAVGTPAATAATLEALRDADRLAEIGAAGWAWATAHYAPKPTAARLLGWLGLAARP